MAEVSQFSNIFQPAIQRIFLFNVFLGFPEF